MSDMKSTVNFGYLIFLSFVAALGGFLFGYDTAVISGTIGSLEIFFIEPYLLSATLSSVLLGIMVSGALLGCVV